MIILNEQAIGLFDFILYFKAEYNLMMLHRRITILITIFLLLSVTNCFPQTNRIDALRTNFNNTADPDKRMQIAMDICSQFYSLSTDSLLHYVEAGKKLSPVSSREYTHFVNYYCMALIKSGRVIEGLAIGDSLIKHAISEENHDSVDLEILGIHTGGLIRNGQNKEAIQEAFNMLSIAEKIKDTINILRAYTNLGWANMEIEQYNVAIKWLNTGASFSKNPEFIARSCVLYANNASCYNNIQRPDSAFYFIELALKYARQTENLTCLANALNIRADMFINKKDYVAAERDMKEAIAVRENIGEPLLIIADMAQLSFFYASTQQFPKGIDIAMKGIEMARDKNNLNKLIFLYTALSENYLKSGQAGSYANTLEVIIKLKDSLYKQNSGDAIAEMEAKYNLQKQQNTIIRQNYDLTRSRYLSIGSSVLLVFGLLLGWILYRNYRLIQSRKMEYAVNEQKSLSSKAVESARENERKRIAADLHDNLGSYAAAITANVKYLREKGKTNDDELMEQLDANAQSMVTQLSDTIWVLKNEHLPITGLADRFKLWMQRLMQNYPNIQYNYSENIDVDIEFTPARILNIFLILKECVNNAIKHSNCTEIKIKFFSGTNWSISIEDNGKGFEELLFSNGSGIGNIKNRAKESGWMVEWKKAAVSGTRVIISETVNH